MQRVNYHYTSLSKQLLFITCFIYFFLIFLIICEIIIYKIEGYYENLNIPLTMFFYFLIFAIITLLFWGHKFFYSQFNSEKIIYYNKILRKSKTLDLKKVGFVSLDKMGIKFYPDYQCKRDEKPLFFVPFFRDGIIDAVQVDMLYQQLKNQSSICVEKNFKILPGYGNKWKIVSVIYGFLTVGVFINCATPLYTVIVLFQNFHN